MQNCLVASAGDVWDKVGGGVRCGFWAENPGCTLEGTGFELRVSEIAPVATWRR